MSQTSYSREQSAYMMGMKCDSRFDTVESPVSLGNIPVGYGVMYGDENDNTVRTGLVTKTTLLFDDDFVASNTIDGKVNTVSWAQVTYATSHDNTAALLVAAIDALSGVSCELDSTDANNRTFIITTTTDVACAVTDVTVAAGASQAGSTTTTGTNDKFYGLALQTHTLEQDANGLVQYVANDIVSVLRIGCGIGWVEEAVNEKDPVYLRFEANGAGKVVGYFRKDADSGKALLLDGVQFNSRTTAAGMVKISINQPA